MQTPDPDSNSVDERQVFLKAKWFPTAIASLALVISIGGHTFTGFNTVNLAEVSNKVDGLESFKHTAESAGGNRDRALQVLNAETLRQKRVIEALQVENRRLASMTSDKSGSDASTGSGFKATQNQAANDSQLAQRETKPLPNGVNESFDELVIKRMKPHWESPPTRPGEKTESDDVVVLGFQLARNGRIQNVQVANTSGMIEFDTSVMKAALRMQEIPEVARMSDGSYAHVANFRLAFSPAMFN